MDNLSTLVLGWAGVGDQPNPTKTTPKPQIGQPTPTSPSIGGKPIGVGTGAVIFAGIPNTREIPLSPEALEDLKKTAKETQEKIKNKEIEKEKQTKCKKCEAFTFGKKHRKKISFGDSDNAKYQFKISNMLSDPLKFRAGTPSVSEGKTKPSTPIEEWLLNDVSFDGLWPIPCTLVEAKGNYAQFLDPRKPEFIKEKVFLKHLAKEAIAQKKVSMKYKTAQLQWYFMEEAAKKYFDNVNSLIIQTFYKPL
ncbi:Tox-REase-5 domain-containing protein [Acinetobacter bereziniae]|uniref:Tox-REase-5 domain-containing protein n=1 Tax=Acinetobacter bereziniae TaxID=106648 RepID=UPI0022EAC6A9|nr:Tox-REase-5 domain-containing protein [Acinetobacter bereziniae]MDA3441283.1 restriction endonuclease fold toxin 5 domain-containing protein [Acinetobacter bereziniae]